ncbi:MAG: peptidylprolyl isomerase [Desulfobulbaceae bacterium]|nr:peptidylprolyl isomerase [Desulfobulbaceae bacterium]
MQRATKNDLVTITYEGFLANGEKFQSSEDDAPLAFQFGHNNLMPDFEKAVLGMAINETKTITIPPEQAFGPRQDDLTMTVSRSSFGDHPLSLGTVVGMKREENGETHQIPATVIAIDNEQVTVDFNHPLAGQELTYNITLISIQPPIAEKNNGCGCTGASCKPTGNCGNA